MKNQFSVVRHRVNKKSCDNTYYSNCQIINVTIQENTPDKKGGAETWNWLKILKKLIRFLFAN
jgi:hypothetical protein